MNKQEFRKAQKIALEKRYQIAYKQNYPVFKECLNIIRFYKMRNILLFIPLYYEPDLLKFRKILSKNSQLFVPFMQDKSLKMVKLRLPFYEKNFGIKEAAYSLAKVKIDLAIVPSIGVDKKFQRIGQGKGFYDRFFQSLSYKPLIIFVQNILALSQESLGENHDIKGDFYINPIKKFYRKESKNVHNTYRCIYRRYNRYRDWIFSRQKNKRCKS